MAFAAAQVASKSLWDAVSDVYETSWQGRDHVASNTQALDVLWQDYSHKLADQVLIPLNTYQAQFPETKASVVTNNWFLLENLAFSKVRKSLHFANGVQPIGTSVIVPHHAWNV